MKICFAVSAMNSGGAERVVSSVINNLSKRADLDIYLLLVSTDKAQSFYKISDSVHICPLLSKESGHGVFSRLRLLKKWFVKIKPDVVIAFLPHICIYTYFALIGTGIPLVVSERNDPNSYSLLVKCLLRYVFKRADFRVFQTKSAQKWYRTVDKCNVIYNPVNLSFLPNEGVFCKRKKVFLSVARFDPQKNFPLLLEAFSKFRQNHDGYCLHLYGCEDMDKNLHKLISKFGLEESVKIMGKDSNWQSKEFDSSCFISSSDFEGMSNSLLEAAALGIPCVATDCPIGGSKEISEVFPNVQLIPVGNCQMMEKAMEESLNRRSCFQGIPKEFELNSISSRWLEVSTCAVKNKLKD